MRVLFDHQIFSYQKYGGISRYFFELINQINKMENIRAKLALAYSDNVYLRNMEGFDFKDVLPSLDIPTKLRFLARYGLNRSVSNRFLRRGDYDVFHPTFFDSSFLPLLHRRPYVMTLLDMTPELFPELFPRAGLYNRLVTSRWIDGKRAIAKNAACIIAISENTRHTL